MDLAPVAQDDLFVIERFQVSKNEDYAHSRKPSLTVGNRRIFFNSACLEYFPEVEYFLPLVDPGEKEFAARASTEEERDSQKWSVAKDGKRSPRNITCPPLIGKILRMMKWKPDQLYKTVGQCILCRGMRVLVFDLAASLAYKRELCEGKDPQSPRWKWVPVESDKEFGLPYAEHRKRYQPKRFEKFTAVEPEPELPLS